MTYSQSDLNKLNMFAAAALTGLLQQPIIPMITAMAEKDKKEATDKAIIKSAFMLAELMLAQSQSYETN